MRQELKDFSRMYVDDINRLIRNLDWLARKASISDNFVTPYSEADRTLINAVHGMNIMIEDMVRTKTPPAVQRERI